VSRGFSFWVARTLSWFSTACCLIVIASFVVFVVNQSGAASRGQLRELGGSITPATANATPSSAHSKDGSASASATESPLHKWLDNTAETLRSPFSSLTSSSHSEWYAQGIGTLLALLLYGFLLRLIARTVQLRTRSLT
jgi:hypothetical protein